MRQLLVLTAASFLAFPAFAQSPDSGFYVGGHIGQAEAKDACDGLAAGVSCDDKDTAWRILGGYQFNRNLAIEGAYTDLGELSASAPGASGSAEANALELTGVGSFPLGNPFSVYGKAGIYRGEVDSRLSGFGGGMAPLTFSIQRLRALARASESRRTCSVRISIRNRSTSGDRSRSSWTWLRRHDRVSTASRATADAVRVASSASRASSPNASPGPSTARVTTSPSSVEARMAT